MKFRAKLHNSTTINKFTKIIIGVSKMAKSGVLRLTADKLFLILGDKSFGGGVSLWIELDPIKFFDDYIMDGLSALANEIYIEIMFEELVRALKPAQTARLLKLRLIKKHNNPCLSIDTEVISSSMTERQFTCDIPIHLLAHKHWIDFQAPNIPRCDISITIPKLKTLKNIIDRMKAMCNFVTLQANKSGDMTIKIETDTAQVATYFTGLQETSTTDELNDDRTQQSSLLSTDSLDTAEVRLDIKKFSQLLHSQQPHAEKMVFNFCNNSMLHICIVAEYFTLQCILPSIQL